MSQEENKNTGSGYQPRYTPPPVYGDTNTETPPIWTGSPTAYQQSQDWQRKTGWQHYSAPGTYQPSQADLYRIAEKRVKKRMEFYQHLVSYLMINLLLWGIAFFNFIGSNSNSIWTLIWPVWVTVFWGIGLVSDYFKTFGISDITRQRMIEDEMRRLRR
jgi:hypothetical protein